LGAFQFVRASSCFAAITHQNNNRSAIINPEQLCAIAAAGLLLLPFFPDFLAIPELGL
jgi:hypothetical protein